MTKIDPKLLWSTLLAHIGHNVRIVTYGDPEHPADICLECEDCCEVVLDAGLYTLCAREEKADEQSHTVTEWCPHCETEIEMKWDTIARGFSVFCPVCGQPLMLCDECRHMENVGVCDYDAESGTCCKSPAAKN